MESPLDRRTFLKGAAASTVGTQLLLSGTAQALSHRQKTGPQDPALTAYVGSFTDHVSGAGAGISVYRVSGGSRRWRLTQVVKATSSSTAPVNAKEPLPANPSFLALDRGRRHLYAVHGDRTQVSSFKINPNSGRLTLLNIVDTGRLNPVYVTVDPSGRFLVVAFYDAPGSVATLAIRSDGSLGPVISSISFPGTPGPDRTRQLGSHPHEAKFDLTGRWLVVPDLGLDRVFVLHMDPATGTLSFNQPGWVQLRAGSGPRHVAFNPRRPYAYTVNELRSTVTTYHWDHRRGLLRPLQVLPSQAPTMTGDTRAAEIAVSASGRHVYASNRSVAGGVGDSPNPKDTIGIWSVNPRTGHLSPMGWVSTQGGEPRFFTLSLTGSRLYAANQRTNTIVPFNVNQDSGHLSPAAGVVDVGAPVCIVFR